MPIVESADGIWLATDPEGWHRLDVRSLEELDEAFVRALFRSDAVSLSPIKQTASHSFFDMLD
ncbi:MAG: hypothetical protein NZT92_04285 [Abditibacteriales bacterium]|nr:hypothetical protein [Abditibacteriales bacterium]MDW8364459.1 hypothetical protein [Abditibacteriales bacterium]